MKKSKYKNLPKKRKANADKDKRFFRVIKILNHLNDGKIKIDSLVKEFNVSKRAIQRDLAIVRIAGFALDCLGEGEYKFSEGISLKDRKLNQEQIAALALFFNISKNMGEKIHKSFEELFKNLTASVPWSERIIVPLMPKAINQEGIPYINEIKEAIDFEKVIEIEYQTSEKDPVKKHRICPMAVFFSEGFHYLFGSYKNDKKERVPRFRIDRIKKLTLTEEYFHSDKNLDDFIKNARNIWGTYEEKHRKTPISFTVFGWGKDYFKFQEIIGGQEMEEKNGELFFKAKVCHINEAVPHIMRNLPCVKDIKPKELEDEILNRINGFLKESKK